MKRPVIAPGEYYHIFNRGNNKQSIFLSDSDRSRFLLSALLFQSPLTIRNIDRLNVQHLMLHDVEIVEEVVSKRFVELNCFTLMPNHFHLIVQERKEGGIAKYLQRLQIGYTKYFNIKNEKIGHHFQGHYKAVRISDNDQLLYLSTYVHRNPREILGWKNKEDSYPWSSFQDYVKNNRWGGLLKSDIVLGQFGKVEEYRNFMNASSAKTALYRDILLD